MHAAERPRRWSMRMQTLRSNGEFTAGTVQTDSNLHMILAAVASYAIYNIPLSEVRHACSEYMYSEFTFGGDQENYWRITIQEEVQIGLFWYPHHQVIEEAYKVFAK